jgi:hypothetical protein
VKIEQLIAERENTHGDYRVNAATAQAIKSIFRDAPNWVRLSTSERESLDQIACKIGRIMCGDPGHTDSWRDIAGYATLVTQQLDAEKQPPSPTLSSVDPFDVAPRETLREAFERYRASSQGETDKQAAQRDAEFSRKTTDILARTAEADYGIGIGRAFLPRTEAWDKSLGYWAEIPLGVRGTFRSGGSV